MLMAHKEPATIISFSFFVFGGLHLMTVWCSPFPSPIFILRMLFYFNLPFQLDKINSNHHCDLWWWFFQCGPIYTHWNILLRQVSDSFFIVNNIRTSQITKVWPLLYGCNIYFSQCSPDPVTKVFILCDTFSPFIFKYLQKELYT